MDPLRTLMEGLRRQSTDGVVSAIVFAIEQPSDVEIVDITIRPTVQG